jgi:hypothetical protein
MDKIVRIIISDYFHTAMRVSKEERNKKCKEVILMRNIFSRTMRNLRAQILK